MTLNKGLTPYIGYTTYTHIYTGYTQKNGAVSKVNKKFISHLTRAQPTPSAATTVQDSCATSRVRFSCLLRGRGARFQYGVAAGKGFVCAPFWGVQICDYSAAWVSCTVYIYIYIYTSVCVGVSVCVHVCVCVCVCVILVDIQLQWRRQLKCVHVINGLTNSIVNNFDYKVSKCKVKCGLQFGRNFAGSSSTVIHKILSRHMGGKAKKIWSPCLSVWLVTVTSLLVGTSTFWSKRATPWTRRYFTLTFYNDNSGIKNKILWNK